MVKKLYLQDIQHEKQFDQLLSEAIQKEKINLIKRLEVITKEEKEPETDSEDQAVKDKKQNDSSSPSIAPSKDKPLLEETSEKRKTEDQSMIKYFHPKINQKLSKEKELEDIQTKLKFR